MQIAGLVARRIVCDVHVGDKLSIGDTYGLIRFGSRLDTYLPAGSAAVGQRGPARGRRRDGAGRAAVITSKPRSRRVAPLRILPSSMSVLAICAGLTSIRFALEGQPYVAIALIAAAAILDGLDGRVARILDAESRMGEEIDSLADAVNFGVAPAVVLYVTMLSACAGGLGRGHAVRGVNRVAAGQVQRAARRRQPAIVHAGVLRRDAGTGRRDLRARTAGRQAAVRLRAGGLRRGSSAPG